jgi:hypothetical protein
MYQQYYHNVTIMMWQPIIERGKPSVDDGAPASFFNSR